MNTDQAYAELEQTINTVDFNDAAWERAASQIAKKHGLDWRWSDWGGIEFFTAH